MAEYIEITKVSGEKLLLNKNSISAVTTKDRVTVVYVSGDMSPFEVKEKYDSIREMLLNTLLFVGYKRYSLPDGGQLLYSEDDNVWFWKATETALPITIDQEEASQMLTTKEADPWEVVKIAPGLPAQLFCKYCGENYLNKKHKEGCPLKEGEQE